MKLIKKLYYSYLIWYYFRKGDQYMTYDWMEEAWAAYSKGSELQIKRTALNTK